MGDPVERARGAVRVARQSWGRATAVRRELPTLIVAGAQRCGTTSLFQALRQHPALVPPQFHKGLHYFDVGYPRGLDWYRAHYATSAALRRLAARVGTTPVQFEVTPYYMFHPLAAQRMAADLPGVKVVAMLRDPVERAYSAYAHERARGFETLDFDQALDAEDDRLRPEVQRILADPAYVSLAHRHQAYAARGRYVEQLRRLESLIGRANIYVMDSEAFFAKPQDEVAALLEFVGLQPSPDMTFEVHNARPRPELPSGTRARLDKCFAESDQELAEWLGWEPSWLRLR